MTSSDPFVSVVVPAHNAITTLERALNSIVVQNYESLEVIVVDDASVDGTSDLVEQFDGLNGEYRFRKTAIFMDTWRAA